MSLHAPSLWLGGLFIYYCSLFVGTAFEDWFGASTVYTITFTNNASGAISFTVSVSWCKQVCVKHITGNGAEVTLKIDTD